MKSLFVPAIMFSLLLVGGCIAVMLYGTFSDSGPMANFVVVFIGAAAAAFGARALQAPTGMSVTDSAGTDAFGNQQWMPGARTTTSTEGIAVGIILILIGLPLVVFGVFVGRLG